VANFGIKENIDKVAVSPAMQKLNILPKTGDIIPFAGTVAPAGWAICDGTSSTPDLRGYFLIGALSSSNIGSEYGSSTATHTLSSNSFTIDNTAVGNHDSVDTGVSGSGAGGWHGHGATAGFGSGAGNNNLLANSTSAGGPIRFNNRPHTHNGSGAVGYQGANHENHNHNGLGGYSFNTGYGHGADHAVNATPSGSLDQTLYSKSSPYIIMNYIVKL
jgi:hypothetical protein